MMTRYLNIDLILESMRRLIEVLEQENQLLEEQNFEAIIELLPVKQDLSEYLEKQNELLMDKDTVQQHLDTSQKAALATLSLTLQEVSTKNAKIIRNISNYKEVIFKCISDAIDYVHNQNGCYNQYGKLKKGKNTPAANILNLNHKT